MSLIRIKFNDTPTDVGAYILPLNPSSLELNESDDYVLLQLVDGGTVKQSRYFDSRAFVLGWSRIPSTYSGISSMLSTLKGYIDAVKYVNFSDVDYRIGVSGWIKIRVLDVKVTIPAGGKVKYNIEMTLVPEA